MSPEDNSLESGYETTSYTTPTGGGAQVPNVQQEPPKKGLSNLSPLKLNHLALMITAGTLILILLIGGGVFIFDKLTSSKNPPINSETAGNSYKVGSNLAVSQASPGSLLQLGQVNELAVNGQLTVSKTLVLTPSSTPTAPVTGQIYYNQSNNAPYYYNGSQFISLAPTAVPQHVTSVGGAAGVLALGSGLSINGNTLSVAGNLLQDINTSLDTPVVNSLQGLTGNVSFTGGTGINISGTTVSNTGVVGLTSSNGSVDITNNGNGSYNLSVSGGVSGSVALGPTTAQDDTSNNPSVYINKTGTGDLLDLQNNSIDAFVVNQSGQITTGTIDYSQVQGAPATTVTDLSGESGSITVGSGLNIAGNTLSNSGVVNIAGVSGAISLGTGLSASGSTLSNSGVTSVSGTANQVIASSSTGGVTLSLPQSIASTSSPTFDNETLNGSLGAAGVLQSGTSSQIGSLVLEDGNGNSVTFTSAGQSNDVALSIPVDTDTNDTLCLETLGNCTGANGGSGDSAYIWNTLTVQPSSNFDISGNGVIGGTLSASTATLGTVGTISGNLTLNSSDIGGSFTIEPSSSQTNATTITIPVDTNPNDVLCLETLANCTGANGGSGDSAYIWNTLTVQPSSNFDISGNGVIGGTLSVASTINGATITGGSLSDGNVSGSSLSPTELSFSGSSGTVTAGSGDNLTIDTTGSADLSLGNSNASTINLGNSSSTTNIAGSGISLQGPVTTSTNLTVQGGLTVDNNASIDGTGTINTLNVTNNATISGTLGVNSSITAAGVLQSGTSGLAGSLVLEDGKGNSVTFTSAGQSNDVALSIPVDTNANDTLCLETLGNCTGANGGSGDSNYIYNQTTEQTNANIDIGAASGTVAAQVQGASGQNILNLYSSASDSTPVAYFDQNGDLVVSSNKINGATITGGALSGGNFSDGNISGSSLSPTNLTFSGSSGSITAGSGDNLTIDTTGSATLSLGNSNASTVNLGNSGSTTNVAGSGINLQGAVVDNSTLSVNGLASLNGGTNTNTLDVSGATILQGAATAEDGLSVEGGLTVGIPGSQTGNLYLSNSTSSNTVDLVGLNPSGSGIATIQFPTIGAGDTDIVCLKALGNCGASANTVTTSSSGTINTIPVFTGADTIANSSITDNGSTVTISEPLSDSTITAATLESSSTLNITPGGSLTVGVSSQELSLVGNSSSTLAESANGHTDTLAFTAPTSANNTVTIPDASGTVCLDNSSDCGFAASGSGVTSVDLLTGAISINDTTTAGSVITIQDAKADGSTLGIATFNSSDFKDNGSGLIDTIQGISTTSDVQFDSLALDNGGSCAAGGNLCIGNNATIYSSNYANPSSSNNLSISGGSQNIDFSNDSGANTFQFPTSGGTGQVICTSGITCASGGGQAVILQPSAEQSDTGSNVGIYLNDNNSSGSANLIQLQTGGNNDFVIDSSGNTTISNTTSTSDLDVSGTLQTETITPNAALTIGSTSESVTLQGTESSQIIGQGSGNSTYLGFATPSGNTITSGSIYYALDNSAATNTSSTPYFICTTAGNCSGTGGSVTALSGSSADYLPLFTGTEGTGGNLQDSILNESGGNSINVAGNLNVGASGQGQLAVGVSSTVNGTIVVNNSTNANNITINQAAAPSSDVTLSLPTTSGTFAVSATGPLVLNSTTGVLSCPTCDSSGGGGGSSAVQSLNSLTGVITLNNASTSGQNIQLNYAKADGSTLGIAAFNATNFLDNGSGVINTAQGIATSSSPTFQDLTLQGTTALTLGSTANDGEAVFLDGTSDGHTMTISQTTLTANQTLSIPNSSGTLADSASGNLSLSALGNLTITNSPNFSTSVTTPLLESSGALSITPSGNLTVGSTSQQFVLQGDSSSSISATSGSDTSTIDFDTPTADNTIYVPDQPGTVCLSTNNCGYASGGSGSYINNQTTEQTNANIDIGAASGTVAAQVQGASGQNILNLYSSASDSTPVAYFDQNGDLVVSSNKINGATITGGALSGGNFSDGNISGSSLSPTNLTFSGSSGSITAGSGDNLTIDTTGSATLSLGNSNASTVNLGNSGSTTNVAGSSISLQGTITTSSDLTVQGGLTVDDNSSLGGTLGVGTVGSISGNLTLNSSDAGGSFVLEPSSSQTNSTDLLIPTDSAANDTLCLETAGNCSGSNAGSGDSSYIWNTLTLQPSSNFDISGNGVIGTNLSVSGTSTLTGSLAANGGLSVAADQNLTLSNGTGSYTQTYTSGVNGTAASWIVTNSNISSTLASVNAQNIALSGSANSSGNNNVTNGININSVTIEAGNTFNAINVGTGLTNILEYNSNSLINGSGILQPYAVSGAYGNLTGTGALASGSIASTFGAINDGANEIQTTGTVQGGVVNASGTLEYNGQNVNNNGTLSNVAYLGQTQTFTGANTFSYSGTALTVSSNAAINGTATIGTLGVTNSATVSGTLSVGTVGTTEGALTLNSSNANGVDIIEPSTSQANTIIISIPTDTTNDTLCLETVGNCSGSNAGSGDSSYIWNTLTLQPSSNFDISGNGVIGGTLSVTGTINTADISGGTLSGSTLSSTGLTFSGSTDNITGPSGSSITLDTTGSAALNLGNSHATTVNLGNSSSTTNINGSGVTVQAGSSNLALTTGTSTGNITFTTNNASSSVIVQSDTNSTTAFQVNNSSGDSTLNVDTADNNVNIGDSYTVGQTGPGGGTIFYISGSGPNATYYEFAPSTWDGGSDPTDTWCSNTSSAIETGDSTSFTYPGTGNQVIGAGRTDTQTMLANCSSGAANLAASYTGGGYSDWFLPSVAELYEMYEYYDNHDDAGGFESNDYWSSSEGSAGLAWLVYFGGGNQFNFNKTNSRYVRPIRAFQQFNNSTILTVAGGATIQGSTILSGGSNLLSTPTAPTITPEGTAGTTDYSYTIVAVNAYGGTTTASPAGSTTTGNATLGSTNYNKITWSAVTGATSYEIYRTVADGASPSTTGLIGSSTSTSFEDTGLTATGNSSPTINTTAQLSVEGSALIQTTSNSSTAFQIQNSSGINLLQVDTSGNNIYLGGNTSSTVDIGAVGSAAYTSTVNIGTSTGAAQSVTIGSTNASSSLTLQAGEGVTVGTNAEINGALGVGSIVNAVGALQSGTPTSAGSLVLQDGSGHSITFNSVAQANSITISVPADTNSGDTLCLVTLANCSGSAAGSGDSSYIWNTTSVQPSSNFDISGNGIIGGTATTGTLDVTSNANVAGTLSVGTVGSTEGTLSLNSSNAGGTDILEASTSQANTTTITIPTDANSTDILCLENVGNCSGSGVTTIGALDGGTANANSATISGDTLYLQSASASYPGLVNNTTQSFSGDKTFTGTLTVNSTINGDTLSSTGLTFGGSTDTITGPSGSSITLDTTGSAALDLGNSHATTVNLGNSSSTTNINGSGVTVQAGSSNLALTTGTSTGNITFTTNNASSSVIVQSDTNSTTAFQVNNSSGDSTLNVDTADNNVNIGDSYTVGQTGPGGGTIFYISGSGPNATYYEFAPSTWDGGSDPTDTWCSNTSSAIETGDSTSFTYPGTGNQVIGAGRTDTQTMLANCSSGAANLAASYTGGGYSDWFLPSEAELYEMYEYYDNHDDAGGFESNYYWSSSEYSADIAWRVNFENGGQGNVSKTDNYYVRPIRAFQQFNNSTILTVAGGATIQGSTILSGGSNLLSTPTAPTITPEGTAGTTDYSYTIVAVNAYGGTTTASPAGSTTTGNATLGSTNYNKITWSAVTGATSYEIYRTVADGASPSTTGLIGSSTSTSFEDTGLTATGNSSPTINTTAQLSVEGSALIQTTSNSSTAFQIQNSSGINLLQVDTSGNNIYLGGNTDSTVDIGAVGSAAYTSTVNIGTSTGAAQSVTIGSTNASSSLTLQAGEGITADTNINQSVSSGSSTGTISLLGQTATNSNTGPVSTTVNGDSITLIGTANGNTGTNVLNGISFNNVTAATNNTFNGLYFGSGYTNGIDFSTSSGITNYINSPNFVVNSNGTVTLGAKGTSNGVLTIASSAGSSGSFSLQDYSQTNATTLYLPTDTNASDYLCLQTVGNCSGANGGSGDTAYIANQIVQQASANIDIQSRTGDVAVQIQGASGENILNLYSSSSNTTPVAYVDQNGDLVVNGNGSIASLSAPGTIGTMLAPTGVTASNNGSGYNYTYEVTAVSTNGAETLASSASSTITSSSSTAPDLSLSWTAPSETNATVSYYKIYRVSTSSSTLTTGLIGTSTSTSFEDTGQAATGSAPALASSGSLSASTTYYYEVTALDGNGGQTTPSSQVSQATSSTYTSITLSWAPVTGARGYNVYRSTTSGVYTTDSYYTVYADSFTDTGATATGTNTAPPTTDTAYANNLSNNATATITIGSGTAQQQLYVGGEVPSNAVGTYAETAYSYPIDAYIQGNYAYVVNVNYSNLDILNIAEPNNPTLIGSIPTGSDPYAVYVQGNYAYVVNNGSNTMTIYNVANPSNPSLVGTVSTGSGPFSIYVQGNYAYVVNNGSNTMTIYNVANPSNPSLVGTVSTGSGPSSIYVQGDYAYVTSGNNELAVYNISNPSNPTYIGESGSTYLSVPNSVYVQGNYAYVTNENNNSLTIYNISNPASPSYVGLVDTVNGPGWVYVQGDYAYVTGVNSNNFGIYNISNPASPTQIGTVSTGSGSQPSSIYVQGNYAYVANLASSTLGVYNVGGAYIQQLSVGGTQTGTLSVSSDGSIGGDLGIQGGLTVGTNSQIDGQLGVAGGATIQGSTVLTGGTNILSVPGQPTVTPEGTTGSTNYSYTVTAVNAYGGQTTASTAGSTSTGNATLSSSNYNQITWTAVTGATSYDIYRTAGGSDGTGLIGSTTTTTFDDTGLAGSDNSSPSYNSTSQLTVAGSALIYTPTNTTTAFQVQNASGSDVLDVDTVNQALIVDGSGPSSAQLYVSNAPVLVSNFTTDMDEPFSVAVSGNYAYVANESGNSLTILNVSNPAAPTVEDNFTTDMDLPRSVAVSGNYAYVANAGGDSLTILNISNPAAPTVEDNFTTDIDEPYSVAVSGNYAYVANAGGDSLTILNISNPAAPTLEDNFTTDMNDPYSVAVSGNYAYVANESGNSLTILNVSNPAAPTVEDNFTTDMDLPRSVAVSGNYAYVANAGGDSLTILNISNPAAPTVEDNFTTDIDEPYSVAVSGNYAYVANAGGDSLTILNISNPAAPTLEDNFTTDMNDPYSVAVSGNYAYVANLSGSSLTALYVGGTAINQANIANANVTGDLSVSSDSNSGDTILNVDTATNTINIGNYTGPATDQTELSAPTLESNTTTDMNHPYSVAVSGNYAYVANASGNSLMILSISNPAAPTVEDNFTTDIDEPYSVAVSGNYAYVANYSGNSLTILNISNPAAPTVEDNFTTDMDGPNSVAVSGNYAYVANASSGNSLTILNVSNPAAPTVEDNFTTYMDNPNSVAVSGNYAYVANASGNSLTILNVSNPAAPTLEDNFTTDMDGPDSVAVSGNYAYVANYSGNSLTILNVSNPAAPTLEDNFTTDIDSPNSVAVSGNYAYVANQGGSLTILNISNPAAPTVEDNFTTDIDEPYSVAVSGNYAYVANYSGNSLTILQVSTSSTLAATGTNTNILGNVNILQGSLGVNGSVLIQGATSLAGGILGGAAISGLSTPSAPTVTFSGTTGTAATWSYEIVAVSASGGTTPASGPGSITTADNTTLSTSNYNVISWTPVSGAVSYDVYRTAVGSSPTTTGLIGTTDSTTFDDTGLAGNGATTPTTNSSGQLTLNGYLTVNGASGEPVAVFNNSSSQIVAEIDSSGNLDLGSSGSFTGNLVFESSVGSSGTVTLSSDVASSSSSYTLYLPSTGPTASGQCLASSSTSQLSFVNCGSVSGGHSDNIVVPAEYAGAVLDAAGDSSCSSDDIGTMTAGNSDNSTNENYYDWTTSQSSSQCYDVVVQIPLPSDFGSFNGTPSIYDSASSGSSIAVEPLTCSGSVDSNYSGYETVSSTSSLSSESLPSALGSSYSSCGYITLRFRLTAAASGGTAQIGTITIPYTTSSSNN